MRRQGIWLHPNTVCKAIGISERQVYNGFAELVKHDLLEVIPSQGRGRRYSITYKGEQILSEVLRRLDELAESLKPKVKARVRK